MHATEGIGYADAGLPRRLLSGALSVAWALGAVLLGYLIWPSSLGGCTTLTIVSGHSMEPTYYTGDLVVARCGPVEKGDVIVYHPPDVGGARVIHRIVGGDATHGWVVQGDNNTFLDPWTPTQDNILGSAKLHLAGVGKFASILISPLTWISLLVVALAIVIWPGRSEPDLTSADEAEPADRADQPPAASSDGDAMDDLVGALGAAP